VVMAPPDYCCSNVETIMLLWAGENIVFLDCEPRATKHNVESSTLSSGSGFPSVHF